VRESSEFEWDELWKCNKEGNVIEKLRAVLRIVCAFCEVELY